MTMLEPNLPTILCCMCSAPIKANATNMCITCLKTQVDITEGIPKEVTMHQCRGCLKWQRPPWVAAELESRELLAICLKKINGLQKVKLIDAGWIWTEPHSKRLKVKLTIQKEVMSGAILQQAFVVMFVVRNQQCDECQASFTNNSWKAVSQVRQKVDHKRTFYFLEQLILKHRAHEKANSIQIFPDGMDFYFTERSHCLRFNDFLEQCVPIKIKTAKKLISADNHSNTQNYKFTYSIQIAPVCKDDLVSVPRKLAQSLGNISSLLLVSQVASTIKVIDPFTLQRAEIENEKYWRDEFRALRSAKTLVEYTVLNVTPIVASSRNGQSNARMRLADVEVVRNSDFGVNDTTFLTTSHLGHLLKAGDTVLGYDLSTSVFNDADLQPIVQQGIDLPDVVLVRKKFVRSQTRHWKLHKMEGCDTIESNRKVEQTKSAMDLEYFMQDLEEDRDMRSQINLYKADHVKTGMEDKENYSGIAMSELLDEMTIDENSEHVVLSHVEAAEAPHLNLEEL